MSHATSLALSFHTSYTPWPCPATLAGGHTDLSLKEESRCLLCRPELRHTLTGPPAGSARDQEPVAHQIFCMNVAKEFGEGILQLCFYSVVFVSVLIPVPKKCCIVWEMWIWWHSLSQDRLSSDLSREKLNQKTEITGSGRELLCLSPPNPGKIMHWPSWTREKRKHWRAATLWNAVREKDIKNKLFTELISQQHLSPLSYLPLLETSYPITSKASSQTRQLHKGQTGGSHQDDSIWLQILPAVQSLPLCGGFLLNSTGRWLEAQWEEKTKNGEYVTGTICSWI